MSRIRSGAADIAAQKILKKIENFELKSGDVVSDTEFAAEFGMSRTPVREAIMALLANGVLERNHTKVIVSTITLTDIIELLEVRDAIEQKTVELIIEHGGLTDTQYKELASIQQTMENNIANGNISENFNADHMFHIRLFEIAGNQRLMNVNKNIVLQSQRLRWFAQLTPTRFAETYREHQYILDALQQKNMNEAKQYMRNHIKNTQANYTSILSNPQWMNILTEIQKMTI